MATGHHFKHIWAPAAVADSDKLILAWDNNRKVSAKFHFCFTIFHDFMKKTIKDYGKMGGLCQISTLFYQR